MKSYCGSDNVDNWSDSRWREEVRDNQVLVLVHQVFLDLLLRGIFTFGQVNLLIIDEIHHTAKNHPYMQVPRLDIVLLLSLFISIFSGFSQIMHRYHDYKEKTGGRDLPRILGLTASVVTEK